MVKKTTQEEVDANLSMTEQVSRDADQMKEKLTNGNEPTKQEPPKQEPKEEAFETVSQSLSFHDFEEEKVLTGTFCGTGKQIGKTKTYLIFDRVNSMFVIVPQWKMLEKLGQMDGERLGKQVVQITHIGTKYDKKNPEEVKFQDVRLATSNVDATGDFCFTPDYITKFMAEVNKPKE